MPSPIPAPAPVTRTCWFLKSNMRVLSVHREHGLAGKPPGHQVLRHLSDLLPRPLQADVRRELAGRDQVGEPSEAHGRGLADELGKQIEAVERRAPGDEE